MDSNTLRLHVSNLEYPFPNWPLIRALARDYLGWLNQSLPISKNGKKPINQLKKNLPTDVESSFQPTVTAGLKRHLREMGLLPSEGEAIEQFEGRLSLFRPNKTYKHIHSVDRSKTTIVDKVQNESKQEVIRKIFHGPDQWGRFLNELGAIAIAGTFIVYDSGIDGENPYFVMELLQRDPFTCALPGVATPLERESMFKMIRALEEAHLRGLIHGDVKENHLLTRSDGNRVLVDYEMAIRGNENGFDPLQQHRRCGTYLPPTNEPFHQGIDTYALAIVLLRAFYPDIKPVYLGETTPSPCGIPTSEDHRELSAALRTRLETDSNCDRRLHGFLMKATAPDSIGRFRNASEMKTWFQNSRR